MLDEGVESLSDGIHRFAGFAYNLAVSLVKDIRINVHSNRLLCLCLN